MEISLELVISVVGLAILIAGLNIKLHERITKLETKVDLFWGALQNNIPSMLIKGNPVDPTSSLGVLVTRMNDKSITIPEMSQLKWLLEKEMKNTEHLPGERVAMALMIATIEAKAIK